MIELHQYPAALGLPNASPFCMKVETFLRMNRLEYKTVDVADPRKAPKGKCPYIVDNGTTVSDSSDIIQHLMTSRSLDDGLSAEDEARGHLVQRCLEEHMYFCVLQERWMADDNWKVVRETFFDDMPGPIAAVVAGLIRRKTKRDLVGHGVGRHSDSEIVARAGQDVKAIATILGDNTYLLGDKPSRHDATALAFIASALRAPLRSPVGDKVRKHANLVSYCDRLMDEYFSDFPAT